MSDTPDPKTQAKAARAELEADGVTDLAGALRRLAMFAGSYELRRAFQLEAQAVEGGAR